LYKRTAESASEGPFIDFKRDWADILSEPDKTFRKLVRHVIAFANVAYRTGIPCRFVFGVDDKTRQIYSIKDVYPGAPPKGKDSSGMAIDHLMNDGVLLPIEIELDKWIGPEVPELSLEYGEIDDCGETKLVAWLQVNPPFNPDECSSHYYLKHAHTSRGYFSKKARYLYAKAQIVQY